MMRILLTVLLVLLAQSVGAEDVTRIQIENVQRVPDTPCLETLHSKCTEKIIHGLPLDCYQRMREAMRAMDVEIDAINPKDSRETRFGVMSIIHIQTKTRQQWDQTMKACVHSHD